MSTIIPIVAAVAFIFVVGFVGGMLTEAERQRRIRRQKGFWLADPEMPFEEGQPVPPERRAYVQIAEVRTKRSTTAR